MIICGMAKKPTPPPTTAAVPAVKRRPGRPPKPGGPTPLAEVQRAYRARLAAVGKIVRLVNAAHVTLAPGSPALASIPDFDPATQLVSDREMFEAMQEELRNALLKLEPRERDVALLGHRNAYLEGESKLQEQHHTNTLKEVITIGQHVVKRRSAG
jgi:hypothetical protein